MPYFITTTEAATACNCTGQCRPPSQGGLGRCSARPRMAPAPVCNQCGQAWSEGHACATAWPLDRMHGCPCKPENGGSGVCGCILGGPSVTC